MGKDPAAVERGRLGGAAGTGKSKRRKTSFERKSAAAAGSAGTGASKRRSPEHYRKMVEARKKAEAEKAERKVTPTP